MKTGVKLGCLLGGLAFLGAGAAQAQTTPQVASAPAEIMATDTAPVGKAAGTILIRLRAIEVMPLVSSSSTSIGGSVAVGNAATGELDGSYFFTDNIAAELIAATTQHTVSVHNSAIGSATLAQIWVLPPTLTVQYHFNPKSAFSPYVGAGLNVSFFYSGTSRSSLVNRFTMSNSVGPALQAGVDWNFSGHWFANVDVKQIFMSSNASINSGAVKAKVALNPTVIGVGIGYRF